jgi:maleamate amidohydrolase
MSISHPWADVISDADRESFKWATGVRPLSAGVRPAVLVVDMTRAFVDSTYPTGWSETGKPAARENARLLAWARQAKLPVFFTHGYPKPGATAIELGRAAKGNPGSMSLPEGTPPGDVIVDELTPAEGEILIDKGTKPSAFFGTPLASYLINCEADTVIVTGMTTSGCVRATVLDAYQYNFSVIVPHMCCADRSQLSHKVSLFDMHMKYADVVSQDTLQKYIESLSADD